MPGNSKDTIYIDIDDEITGIIDKVRDSKGKLVALVLPKRAATFQSIVNMKLLKRAADSSQKHLVLITSEAGLLPLAGAAGVHVAKTLNSKPEIPPAPKDLEDDDEAVEESGETPEEATAETAGDQPVGKLAGAAAAGAVAADGVETVELDNDESAADKATDTAKKAAAPAGAAAKKAKDKKGGKKFNIPNFGKFRTKLIIAGVALLALILFIIFGLIVLPKAIVNIKTNASNVPVDLNLNLSTTAKTLETDSETPTVPAKLASDQKTYSQQVPTTGQKNNGSKASGSVSITNCSDDDTTLPAGTGFSSNGNTYISQQSVTVPHSDFFSNGNCKNNGKASVNIQAQSGGSSFNLPSGSQFSIAGGSSKLSAQGSTISGGTDNIVQIVNQNDVNKARSQIAATNDSVEKQRLQNDLKKDGWYAITQTFSAGTPNITQSAQVGAIANSVTVTEVINYTMFGAKEKDLKTLVDSTVKSQIDTGKQSILSEGLDKAVFGVSNSSTTAAQLTMQAKAEVGPDLDIAGIQESARGKKPAEVRAQLEGNPDVTAVDVKLSPFWVSSVPKKTSKIHIKIAKPTTTKSNSNANNP
jgi:hypothetical protein